MAFMDEMNKALGGNLDLKNIEQMAKGAGLHLDDVEKMAKSAGIDAGKASELLGMFAKGAGQAQGKEAPAKTASAKATSAKAASAKSAAAKPAAAKPAAGKDTASKKAAGQTGSADQMAQIMKLLGSMDMKNLDIDALAKQFGIPSEMIQQIMAMIKK